MTEQLLLSKGRLVLPIEYEVLGELTLDDLQLLQPGHTSKPPALKRISERHHALARALAIGMSPADASITYGYAASTISNLQTDPSFKSLLDFYSRSEDAVLRGTQERMAAVANEALDVIAEKFEDPEERAKISIPTALQVLTATADRSGNGPATSQAQVHIHLGLADRLRARREQADAAMRDITPAVAAE